MFNLKSVELCPKRGCNRKLIVFSVHCLVLRLQEGKHASREVYIESIILTLILGTPLGHFTCDMIDPVITLSRVLFFSL